MLVLTKKHPPADGAGCTLNGFIGQLSAQVNFSVSLRSAQSADFVLSGCGLQYVFYIIFNSLLFSASSQGKTADCETTDSSGCVCLDITLTY
jgi:hypothetical protein